MTLIFLTLSLTGWIFRQAKKLSLLADVIALLIGNKDLSFRMLALRIRF